MRIMISSLDRQIPSILVKFSPQKVVHIIVVVDMEYRTCIMHMLTNSPTAESELVGHVINGLRAGYNPIVNSWRLDEIRGVEDSAGPDNLSELGSALYKFESSKAFLKSY